MSAAARQLEGSWTSLSMNNSLLLCNWWSNWKMAKGCTLHKQHFKKRLKQNHLQTTLTEYFALNQTNSFAHTLLYVDLSRFYTWDKSLNGLEPPQMWKQGGTWGGHLWSPGNWTGLHCQSQTRGVPLYPFAVAWSVWSYGMWHGKLSSDYHTDFPHISVWCSAVAYADNWWILHGTISRFRGIRVYGITGTGISAI